MTDPAPTTPSTEPPKALPPFIQIAMTAEGMTVQTNVTDKLMVLALLEGAKFNLMAPTKTTLISKPNGINHDFLKRLRG